MFGSIFADIDIHRTDGSGNLIDLINVPLSYANRDKILARLIQDPAINRADAITLPRMSFEMGNPVYDGDRKLPGTKQRFKRNDTDPDTIYMQYDPVPWNFPFNLYVYVKNSEDGTKIVEQILPYFTPTLTFTETLVEAMGFDVDIPITLLSCNIQDDYAGKFDGDRRALIWTISFVLKGYLYGPVRKKKLIKFIDTGFYVEGGNSAVNTIRVQPGLDANGYPTSNASLSVNAHTIFLDDSYGFIETKT